MYFITHLIFALSKWAACRLDPQLFPEELTALLLSGIPTMCKWSASLELVSEIAHYLRILRVPSHHRSLRKCVSYLLDKEVKGSGGCMPKGKHVKSTFYLRAMPIDIYVYGGAAQFGEQLGANARKTYWYQEGYGFPAFVSGCSSNCVSSSPTTDVHIDWYRN